MTVVTSYATLAEAKGWIGIGDTVDDTILTGVVATVSRWIDEYCRRQFWQTAAGTVRHYDPESGWCVELGDTTAVTLVETDADNDGTWETTWAGTDWQLLPIDAATAFSEPRPYTKLWAAAGLTFPCTSYSRKRLARVRVTGTFGWPAVPAAVKTACQMQTSRMFQRRKSPEGVAGWGEFGPVRISGRLDPDVALSLSMYRLLLVR